MRELRLSWFVSGSAKDTSTLYGHIEHQAPLPSF